MNGRTRFAIGGLLALAAATGCGRETRREGEAVRGAPAKSAAPERLVNHRLEPVAVAFDRDLVELELPFGEERSAEVKLIGPKASDGRLSVKEATRAGFDVEVVPARGGGAETVRFRVRGESVGMHVGRVTFATGLGDPAELAVNYTWRVTGTLSVNPTNPLLDLSARGPKRVVIEVQSSQRDFAVRAAEVLEGPFDASFERIDGGRYQVTVTARKEAVSPEARGTTGKLLIVSNDPTEPKKELPLVAIGKYRE